MVFPVTQQVGAGKKICPRFPPPQVDATSMRLQAPTQWLRDHDPLGALPDASQMLPAGSWVAAQPGASPQQDADGLLRFPVREEPLSHHSVEEQTCPTARAPRQRRPWHGSGVGQRSAPTSALRCGHDRSGVTASARTPQSRLFASSLPHLPHQAPSLF